MAFSSVAYLPIVAINNNKDFAWLYGHTIRAPVPLYYDQHDDPGGKRDERWNKEPILYHAVQLVVRMQFWLFFSGGHRLGAVGVNDDYVDDKNWIVAVHAARCCAYRSDGDMGSGKTGLS